MDVEKLISCVQENRCLWDMTDKNYHNRDISRQKWERVAAELNTNSETAKVKWRGLRDTFRKELSKIPKKRSGEEGRMIKDSKWAYFKSLEFLKDQFQRRQLHGNVPKSSQLILLADDEDTQNSILSPAPAPAEDEPELERQTPLSPQNTRNEATPSKSSGAPPKKIAKTSVVKQLMKIEEEKLQMFKQRNSASLNEDPDHHFLMSLLPYLRKVPEERKMFVRTKLQHVFLEEERFGDLHSAPSISSNPSSASDGYAHDDLASYFSSVSHSDKI